MAASRLITLPDFLLLCHLIFKIFYRLAGSNNPMNPFLNGGGGGESGGYNYGMTGKGEDEYIRRSFQVQ